MLHKVNTFTFTAALFTIGLFSFKVDAEDPHKIQQLRQVIENSSITNKQEILSNADAMETSEQQQYLQRKVDALRGLSNSAISYEERNPNGLKEIRTGHGEDFFSSISNFFGSKKEAPTTKNIAATTNNQNSNSQDAKIDAFSVAVAESTPSIASREAAQANAQNLIQTNGSQGLSSPRSLSDLKSAYAEKHPARAETFHDEFKGVPESEQVAVLSRHLGLETNQDG